MLTALTSPAEDTQATDLCLELGSSPLPAEAVLPLHLGIARLELRVLGRSHQAILEWGRGSCSEVVASLADRPAGLPQVASRDLGGLLYRFGSEVLTLSPREFSAHARAVRAEVGQGRSGLVGSFEDEPESLTALRARRRDDEIRWQTWHAYPRTCEIVVTRTVVRAR